MSVETTSWPRRGYALFPSPDEPGAVLIRTVIVSEVLPLLNQAHVTESVTGAAHVLPIGRVASESTLAEKRSKFAEALARPLPEKMAGMTASAPAETSGAMEGNA